MTLLSKINSDRNDLYIQLLVSTEHLFKLLSFRKCTSFDESNPTSALQWLNNHLHSKWIIQWKKVSSEYEVLTFFRDESVKSYAQSSICLYNVTGFLYELYVGDHVYTQMYGMYSICLLGELQPFRMSLSKGDITGYAKRQSLSHVRLDAHNVNVVHCNLSNPAI